MVTKTGSVQMLAFVRLAALQSVTDYCVFTEGNFNKHWSARHGHTRARNLRVKINPNAHQDKCYTRLCVLEAAHHHISALTSTCRCLRCRSKSTFPNELDTEFCRWFDCCLCLASLISSISTPAFFALNLHGLSNEGYIWIIYHQKWQ